MLISVVISQRQNETENVRAWQVHRRLIVRKYDIGTVNMYSRPFYDNLVVCTHRAYRRSYGKIDFIG